MIRPLYIFDIDGTLSLPDHRRHLVEAPACPQCSGSGYSVADVASYSPNCSFCKGAKTDPRFKPDWIAFYDACGEDAENKPVMDTMRRLIKTGAEVWFFTGRTDRVRQLTEDWLWNHTWLTYRELQGGQVVMRRDGDWRADDVIKQEMLDAMLPEDRARLVAVFDDRARVVAMWRRNGIPCFQVAEGNF